MALDLNAPISWAGTKSVSRSAWAWWTRELASLIPADWRNRAVSASRGPELTLSKTGWLASGFSATYDGPLVARRDLLGSLAKAARGRAATIVLPKSSVLSRAVPVPAGAMGRIKEIVRLQLDRFSPLPADQTVWTALTSNTSSDRADGLFVMADRHEVEAIVDELRDAGFRSFAVVDPTTRAVLFKEDRDAPSRQRILAGVWGLAALLLVASVGVTVWRTQTRMAELEAEIAILKPKAEAVAVIRREALATNDVAAALASTMRSRDALSIWAEVTRLLPEGAWLSAFEFTRDGVRLEGFAKASADVLSSLATSEAIEAPMFEGALQRQPDLGADRFVLRAGFKPLTAP